MGLQSCMAGTGDDIHLLLAGQVDELDGVAGDTDGCLLYTSRCV